MAVLTLSLASALALSGSAPALGTSGPAAAAVAMAGLVAAGALMPALAGLALGLAPWGAIVPVATAGLALLGAGELSGLAAALVAEPGGSQPMAWLRAGLAMALAASFAVAASQARLRLRNPSAS